MTVEKPYFFFLNSAHVHSFVASTLYANCNQIQFVQFDQSGCRTVI